MDRIDTLIRELEEATEGSRKLDARIHLTRRSFLIGLGFTLAAPQIAFAESDGWVVESGHSSKSPHYTTSIDAARTLVPDDWAWIVEDTKEQGCGPGREGIGACVWNTMDVPPIHRAETPALALCIASLRARQAKND